MTPGDPSTGAPVRKERLSLKQPDASVPFRTGHATSGCLTEHFAAVADDASARGVLRRHRGGFSDETGLAS
jgi:hypothetical protein